MKELLDEEKKAASAAAAVLKKKTNGKARRKKDAHETKQEEDDIERIQAKAQEQMTSKTDNVSAVPVAAAALKDKVEVEEEERKQQAMERNSFTSSSTSAAAAEEMMREAGARQSCEATRGVGFCLAGNNIAAQNKGKTKLKGAQETSGAAGGREISQVDSRECALANGTPQDLTRFQTFQGIALYKTCTNRHPLKVCAYAYFASICVCIFQTQVVAWYPKMRILGLSAPCAW
jgi:hypothetical protein